LTKVPTVDERYSDETRAVDERQAGKAAADGKGAVRTGPDSSCGFDTMIIVREYGVSQFYDMDIGDWPRHFRDAVPDRRRRGTPARPP